MNPSEFWDLTPRELSLRILGARRKLINEHNQRAWAVYHIAYLPRMKRPPKIEKLLYKEQKRQTWQQQLQIAKIWHMALGNKNG